MEKTAVNRTVKPIRAAVVSVALSTNIVRTGNVDEMMTDIKLLARSNLESS